MSKPSLGPQNKSFIFSRELSQQLDQHQEQNARCEPGVAVNVSLCGCELIFPSFDNPLPAV
jgi:hypothetical protein